jgi:hypothetical protein
VAVEQALDAIGPGRCPYLPPRFSGGGGWRARCTLFLCRRPCITAS